MGQAKDILPEEAELGIKVASKSEGSDCPTVVVKVGGPGRRHNCAGQPLLRAAADVAEITGPDAPQSPEAGWVVS